MESFCLSVALPSDTIFVLLMAIMVVFVIVGTFTFLRYRKRTKRRLNKLLGLITVRNSHDLKVLKENEEKYRSIVFLLNEGIILTDANHQIVFVNKCACKHFKISEKELCGKKLSDFAVGKSEATRLDELLDRNKAGTVAREEFLMSRGNEDTFWASLSFTFPGHLKDIHDGAVIVMVDVSGHIMLEQKMRKLTNNLVQKVKQLDCVFEMQQMLGQPNQSADDILKKSLKIIPKGLRHEHDMRVEIIYFGKEYRSPDFYKSKWHYTIPLKAESQVVGQMTVSFIGTHPPLHSQPFRIGEKVLLKSIAEKIMMTISVVEETTSRKN